jgi:PUA-domain protein
MPGKHRRYFLKEKESRELLERASHRFSVSLKQIFGEKTSVEVVETEFGEVCLINGKPVLVVTRGTVYPTLVSKELFEMFPRIVVDMGAVPFVCKGANIMAPGIRRFEGSFVKGDIVFVVDEKHGKPIALGEATYDVEEAKNVKQGMVIANIHYVGDSVWELIKDLANKTR